MARRLQDALSDQQERVKHISSMLMDGQRLPDHDVATIAWCEKQLIESIREIRKLNARMRNREQKEIAAANRRAPAPKAWTAAELRLRAVAHNAVTKAVKRGTLVRPDRCEICNREGKINGHHDSYNKPLEVRWLCSVCHCTLHSGGSLDPIRF